MTLTNSYYTYPIKNWPQFFELFTIASQTDPGFRIDFPVVDEMFMKVNHACTRRTCFVCGEVNNRPR